MKKQTALWCVLLVLITICQAVFIKMLSVQNKDNLMTMQTVDTMEVATGNSAEDIYNENVANGQGAVNSDNDNEVLENMDTEHDQLFIFFKIAEGLVLLVIVIGVVAQAVYIMPHSKQTIKTDDENLLLEQKKLENYLVNNGVIKFDDAGMVATRLTSHQFSDNKQIDKADYTDVVKYSMIYFTKYNVINNITDELNLSELEKLKRLEYMSLMTYAEIAEEPDREDLNLKVLEKLKEIKDMESLYEFRQTQGIRNIKQMLGLKAEVDKTDDEAETKNETKSETKSVESVDEKADSVDEKTDSVESIEEPKEVSDESVESAEEPKEVSDEADSEDADDKKVEKNPDGEES